MFSFHAWPPNQFFAHSATLVSRATARRSFLQQWPNLPISSNMDTSSSPCRTAFLISATNWTLAMEEANTEKDQILFNLQLILILIGGFNFQPTWNGQIGSSSQFLGKRKDVPSHQPEYYWSESVRNTNWQKEPESKTKIHSSRRTNVSGSSPEWSPRSESGFCQICNAPPVVDAQDGFLRTNFMKDSSLSYAKFIRPPQATKKWSEHNL